MEKGYFAVGQEIGDVSEAGKSGGKGQGGCRHGVFVELKEDGAR